MAFVGSNVGYTAAGTVILPIAQDVGGAGQGFTLFSHLLSTAVATIAFDSAPSFVITAPATGIVLAIPPAARQMIMTGTPAVILGRMD